MDNILEIKDLIVRYETEDGVVEAVNSVNLSLRQGAAVGLVGETGAGKTTLAKSILRLIQWPPGRIVSGQIFYNGKDLTAISEEEMCKIRGNDISMIFQDPMTALNPVMTIGKQISEVIAVHEKVSSAEAEEKMKSMLTMVGIDPQRAEDYPHQFSGGMKQRVVIAIALACNPNLLVADEPTTALDVTIQAQVLDLIKNLREKLGTSLLLITHDLGVVAQNCEYVAIMYAGEIIEYGSLREIFKNSLHPYTEGLFNSIPKLHEAVNRLKPIEGLMPDPANLPQGCKFHPRCKYAKEICLTQIPVNIELEDGHTVCCHRYAEENDLWEGAEGHE
ncbi:ABC transporter ATP-binding protein [Emergencia timonensis]|uniref:ABC transporter ATP-binding protein n=1 Tax=Emergencia timonensis TaxID=1776384 RepID=UPI00399365D0